MNTITPLAPPAPEPEHTGSRHTTRTKVLVAAGAVVALGGAFLTVDLLTNSSHRTTHRFTDAVTELDLDVSAGTVRVVGSDDPVVTVDVTTHGGVHRPSHSETLVGGHLRLHSGCGFDIISPTCGVDFVVHVPTATAVVAHADGATIDLAGTSGNVDLSINGGDVDMQFGSAPHTIKADVNGGRVVVEIPDDGTAYRVDADAEGGSARIGVRTDPSADRAIDVHANGGDVAVRYVTVAPLDG